MNIWPCYALCDFTGCSGVLAIVAYGLYFASQGNLYLSKDGKKQFHTLKSTFSFMAETIVLLLVGIFVGEFHARADI